MKKPFLSLCALGALLLAAALGTGCQHTEQPAAAPVAGVTSEKDFQEALQGCSKMLDDRTVLEIQKMPGGYVFQIKRKEKDRNKAG